MTHILESFVPLVSAFGTILLLVRQLARRIPLFIAPDQPSVDCASALRKTYQGVCLVPGTDDLIEADRS